MFIIFTIKIGDAKWYVYNMNFVSNGISFFFFLQNYANLSVTKFSRRVMITCTFIFQNMYTPCMTQAWYLWCVFTSQLNIFHDHAHVRYHVLGHMHLHANHAFKVFLNFFIFNHATMLKEWTSYWSCARQSFLEEFANLLIWKRCW